MFAELARLSDRRRSGSAGEVRSGPTRDGLALVDDEEAEQSHIVDEDEDEPDADGDAARGATIAYQGTDQIADGNKRCSEEAPRSRSMIRAVQLSASIAVPVAASAPAAAP